MKTIIEFFTNIYNWLMCFLTKDCKYSIKRLLALLTFNLIAYLAIFTDKSYLDLIGFIIVLLGISSYDKITWNKYNKDEKSTENRG